MCDVFLAPDENECFKFSRRQKEDQIINFPWDPALIIATRFWYDEKANYLTLTSVAPILNRSYIWHYQISLLFYSFSISVGKACLPFTRAKTSISQSTLRR